MTDPSPNDRTQLRWSVYFVLIAISAGSMIGRTLSVDSVDLLSAQRQLWQRGERRWIMRPFLSGNDRSRWCTVRSLVEFGTYEIDQVIFEPGTIDLDVVDPAPPPGKVAASERPRAYPKRADTWDTIDKVRHKNSEGKWRFYSSKPPLLATLLAAEYWLIYNITGATLDTPPYDLARWLLILNNVVPLVVAFVLMAKLVERFGVTDWGKVFVMGAATFGTFLTTFAVTLNNHLPAAVSATVALYAAVRIWFDGERRLRYFAVAGLFAAFTAANELPALAFFVAMAAALAWKAWRETLTAFAPAAAVVIAAFLGTNKIAHDRWLPPYAFRNAANPDENWYDYTYYVHGAKGPAKVETYWQPERLKESGSIDGGEPWRIVYAFNVLIGHHGIFSLTPIWLLSLWGAWLMWKGADAGQRQFAVFVASISMVCLLFYLLRPEIDRNYGGQASGFRWMFWFTPLWLVTLLPAADRMGQARWQRILALFLLGASVLSVSYPTWNPWTHPWIYDFVRGPE
jgi:hypothetical protein